MTLRDLLQGYLEAGEVNPPEEKEDPAISFLRALSESGKLGGWTEWDWIEAGRSVGMTDEEIGHWMEAAASWIEDTTDKSGNASPSFWVEGEEEKRDE